MERAILHCDMNNFFASVECVLDPTLKDEAIAVCGNVEERHGIVMARNYKAKSFGVNAAEPIWMAKKKCPNLVIVNNPHYDKYVEYSEKAREIYRSYTDYVEPMGLDECWLDVTESLNLYGEPKKIADDIRNTIREKLGLTISVGVSFNKTFAKLGSDMKKPDATTVISKENFREKVWPLPATDMIGVGRGTRKILDKYFIRTIGDIAKESPKRLQYLLGKNGVALYEAANGIEDTPVQKYEELEEVKSISHGITTVRDMENDDEVWKIVLELTKEIALKLRVKHLRAGGVSVSVRDSKLLWQQYRKKLKNTEQSASNIAKIAFDLFREKYDWANPVRNITIGTMYLTKDTEPEQLTIFENYTKKEKIEKAEKVMEELNMKYGNEIITTAVLLDDKNLPANRRKIKYGSKKSKTNN